jgi:hypothetical protein
VGVPVEPGVAEAKACGSFDSVYILRTHVGDAVSLRVCPKCGGKKGPSGRTCQKCAPPRRGWPGLKGPNHPAWRGGTSLDRDGYVKTYDPSHPWPRKGGYVREHIRVMELHIGRRITRGEAVHHIDHDRTNNALENLELLTHGEHSRLHRATDTHLRSRDSYGRFAAGKGGGSQCPNS